MSSKQKAGAIVGLATGLLILTFFRLHNLNIPVLQPHGPIGQQEKRLIIVAVTLSAVVVIPVYILLFSFAWKYRESNKKAKYEPNLDGSRIFESIWWSVPIIIITILAVITWHSSNTLDPFRRLNSLKPIPIQVVSLQWKWLFIYPKQNIATVNYVQFPANMPVDFEITSDAPMNSFWIPQLGGQIYAMSGMATHLNLVSSQIGIYQGSSANISGTGFASMHFIAKATSEADFNNWVSSIKAVPSSLTLSEYSKLAAPSILAQTYGYGSVKSGIFNQIIGKYEAPVPLTEIQ